MSKRPPILATACSILVVNYSRSWLVASGQCTPLHTWPVTSVPTERKSWPRVDALDRRYTVVLRHQNRKWHKSWVAVVERPVSRVVSSFRIGQWPRSSRRRPRGQYRVVEVGWDRFRATRRQQPTLKVYLPRPKPKDWLQTSHKRSVRRKV